MAVNLSPLQRLATDEGVRIEQGVGWLKECRRLCTRFEKLAVNFLAMIHVAFIERYCE